jgi:hypothetical protein
MTTLFRLKKEALPFFEKKYASCIYDYETWSKINVSQNALEAVEPVFITYGRKDSDILTSTCSWSSEGNKDRGSRFNFTINIPSHSNEEYRAFADEKNIRTLMDEIQELINNKIQCRH